MVTGVLRKMRFLPIILSGLLLVACAANGGEKSSSRGEGKHTSRMSQGMVTAFTITLRRFKSDDAIYLVSRLADGSLGYQSHNLLKSASGLRIYEYRSSIKAFALEEQLNKFIEERGFDADRDVEIYVQGTTVIVDRL